MYTKFENILLVSIEILVDLGLLHNDYKACSFHQAIAVLKLPLF